MILYPAIDIKDGQVVRLQQGDYDQVTQYGNDPIVQAQAWARAGAEWIHVVDLDAAKSGQPANGEIILEMAKQTGLKIQVGGGIRSLEMAQHYIGGGVARVVVGTQAVKDPDFLGRLGKALPGKVALGLDTRDGKIAIQGWTEAVGQTVGEYLHQAPLQGVATLIFTDIARDGTLTGPNTEALRKVCQISPIEVIASGGISELQDLKTLRELGFKNLSGVIVGKALYEGKFTVEEGLNQLK